MGQNSPTENSRWVVLTRDSRSREHPVVPNDPPAVGKNVDSVGKKAETSAMAQPTVAEKISRIRALMKRDGVQAYIIPDSDPHQSEYLPDRYRTRTWISGFSGSAGTVVITQEAAGLWTDSRYYLEAGESLHGTPMQLFRDGAPGVPEYEQWIASILKPGEVVAFDDAVYSVALWRKLHKVCREQKIEVRSGVDYITPVWNGRPPLPEDPIYILDDELAGRSVPEKLEDVRRTMKASRSDYLISAALDEVAWLYNLRGSDVAYNPIFLSYLAVTQSQAMLFIDPAKVPAAVKASLKSNRVEVRAYDEIQQFVEGMPATAGVQIWPAKISVRLFESIPDTMRVAEGIGPITRLKAVKNRVEQEHLRNLMIRDGAALERFFFWLNQTLAGGATVTERSAAARLREFRAKDSLFVGESFNTIMGYRAHGAIVHYGATEKSNATLAREGLLLVDSGGQYRDGTTDITRVVALGTPTSEERRDYTLVLKAHIALATARFPAGTSGQQLDSIARDVLWRHGLAYGHGTGHGVGFFLNVHEGPQRIGSTGDPISLEPGMYTSNEPGLYREGKHGVRVENLVLCQADGATDFGGFLSFETITLCHLEPELIDPTLLTAFEKSWVNAYQRRVFDQLSSHLDTNEREWLRGRTRVFDVQ